MQGTASKLSVAGGQLLEEPLFVCCLLEAFMLGKGGKLGGQPWSQGCTSLQDRPNQPSSRPVFPAGPTKLRGELPP